MNSNNGMLATFFDMTSVAVVLGTIADVLPPLAAILSIVWILIRIYETRTIQCWLHCAKRIDKDDTDIPA